MFLGNVKAKLLLALFTLLIVGDAAAVADQIMPPRLGGLLGLLLLGAAVLSMMYFLKQSRPEKRSAPAKGVFGLYAAVALAAYLLYSVYVATRNEPIVLRALFCGIDVVIITALCFWIHKVYSPK